MDWTNIAGNFFTLAVKYMPEIITLAHSIVHDLRQHPDEAVRKAADDMHAALHADPAEKP